MHTTRSLSSKAKWRAKVVAVAQAQRHAVPLSAWLSAKPFWRVMAVAQAQRNGGPLSVWLSAKPFWRVVAMAQAQRHGGPLSVWLSAKPFWRVVAVAQAQRHWGTCLFGCRALFEFAANVFLDFTVRPACADLSCQVCACGVRNLFVV